MKDVNINELNIAVNDLKGKFVKPTLKKVSKYENKFAKLQKKVGKGLKTRFINTLEDTLVNRTSFPCCLLMYLSEKDMLSSLPLLKNTNKQVHSLCVDSRPGDRLQLAKGPPSFFIILLVSDTV